MLKFTDLSGLHLALLSSFYLRCVQKNISALNHEFVAQHLKEISFHFVYHIHGGGALAISHHQVIKKLGPDEDMK